MTLFIMVQGMPIPETVQWIVICMSATMSHQDIAMYTDISKCMVRHILSHFKNMGKVKASQYLKPQLHHLLCDYEVEVSLYIPTFECYLLKDHYLAFIEDSEQYARPLS